MLLKNKLISCLVNERNFIFNKIIYGQFFFIFFLFSCNTNFNSKQKITSYKSVAVAGSEEYYFEDYKSNFILIESSKDSLALAKKCIENWAIESLFYQEALSKLTSEEIDIEKQVESYKKSLVNYIYQTKLIEANLDTNISKAEIEEYYYAHQDNFILKENIVKVNYFKIPLRATALDKIKGLLKSKLINQKDAEQLKKLCSQNAENFFLNDSTWIFLDDVKKEIPKLRDIPDFVLEQGKVIEFTDDLYFYYLKIKDMKTKNGLSPINFEKQNIKNFIINLKKTQLINDYKNQLLEKAKSEKKFTIY